MGLSLTVTQLCGVFAPLKISRSYYRRETNFFVSCISVNGHFAFKDIYRQLSKKLFILEQTLSSLTQILINSYNIKWP